jgi:pimeloyl-ACP methyl ester carboxylesterase
LRFDYHGIGESEGEVTSFQLDEPFVDDLDAAATVFAARGIRRVALVGVCFGARTTLAACRTFEQLEGVILMATPVRDYMRSERAASKAAEEWSIRRYLSSALQPHVIRGIVTDSRRRRVYRRHATLKARALAHRLRRRLGGKPAATRPPFFAGLDDLAARATPTLLLYTSGSDHLEDFDKARAANLISGEPSRNGDWPEVRVVDVNVHTFDTLDAQRQILELVPEWLLSLVESEPA